MSAPGFAFAAAPIPGDMVSFETCQTSMDIIISVVNGSWPVGIHPRPRSKHERRRYARIIRRMRRKYIRRSRKS